MSSSKVTLSEIIDKWKSLVTGSTVTRWDEMEAFFQDVAEADIPAIECMRNKDRILRIWFDLTWAEAQKNNPSWHEKWQWENRKKSGLKTWDKWYGEYAKTAKPVETSKKPVEESVDDSPVFDNIEDFRKWKAKRQKMG